MGFRLAYLSLTLTYSKGQLGSWNGVSPNILVFLLYILQKPVWINNINRDSTITLNFTLTIIGTNSGELVK